VNRGDVYLAPILLPNRDTTASPASTQQRDKLLVALQDSSALGIATEIAVVVGSTFRGNTLRSFEVLVGAADGFLHDTVIDGRWVFTLKQAHVTTGRHLLTLSPARMTEVAIAIVRGLQLH